jgi:hypothetical protein
MYVDGSLFLIIVKVIFDFPQFFGQEAKEGSTFGWWTDQHWHLIFVCDFNLE